MQASYLTQIMLPIALALIMFGMGLTLTKDDFIRLWKLPKPILVGLTGQLLLMPLIAVFVVFSFELPSELAVGLMILAACPGGTTSNVICHLGRANLALSVSLTAITTLVCVFWTPFIIKLSIEKFSVQSVADFSLTSTTLGLIFITLLPVVVGVWLRQKFPSAAMRRETFFRRFSALFMLAMIVAILIQERAMLIESFNKVFAATLSLNILSIVAGILLAKIFKLSQQNQVTLGIEIGIQNASMAMLIAITFLNSPAFATSAGVYGITMFIGAALLLGWKNLSK